MKVTKAKINEILIFEPIIFSDNRGNFVETFRQEFIEKELGTTLFVQENESFSTQNVLRGLHYQIPPFAQAKLVRCVFGKILDIAVDIRKNSPTFGQYIKVELSDKNKKQVFVPKGFAHGFVVLSKKAIVNYKVDAYYNKNAERSIFYADKELQIDWEVQKVILSDKDKKAPMLKEAELF